MTPGLALAIERVKADAPPPLTIAQHPIALRALGECLDEREQRGEQDQPAA
jgi:hypothetical protein